MIVLIFKMPGMWKKIKLQQINLIILLLMNTLNAG